MSGNDQEGKRLKLGWSCATGGDGVLELRDLWLDETRRPDAAGDYYDLEMHGGEHNIIGGVLFLPDTNMFPGGLKTIDTRMRLTHGWLSLSAVPSPDGIIGRPLRFRIIPAGEALPTGEVLATECMWAEFELLAEKRDAALVRAGAKSLLDARVATAVRQALLDADEEMQTLEGKLRRLIETEVWTTEQAEAARGAQ